MERVCVILAGIGAVSMGITLAAGNIVLQAKRDARIKATEETAKSNGGSMTNKKCKH